MFRRKPKVFGIGRNKTGTTSLTAAMDSLGYRIGSQEKAELLIEDWARRDFASIIRLSKSADFFQDIPFSLPFTFQALDQAFPGSKFVLTVRGSADEWWQSMRRFRAKIMGSEGAPTTDNYRAYRYRDSLPADWFWRSQELIYGLTNENIDNEQLFKAHYLAHNLSAREYFRQRPADLLELDLSQEDALGRLVRFLEIPDVGNAAFPHLNRTR